MSLLSGDLNDRKSPHDRVSSEDAFVLSRMTSSKAVPCARLSLLSSVNLRLSVEFQWFFIALSVLPGRSFAIDAHLFP